jgi:tetratricopeptide (TPR) repeat protein
MRMRASKRGRGVRVWALPLSLLALSLVTAFTASASAADPPPARKATPLSHADRKKLLADRDLLEQQTRKLLAQRNYAGAESNTEQLLALDRKLFGETSPQVAERLTLVARIDERLEDWQAAVTAREEVFAIRLKQFGKESWQSADARRAVEFTAELGRLDLLQLRRLWNADAKAVVGARLERQGKFKEAILLAQQVIDARKAVLGLKHWQVADALYRLGRLRLISGDRARGARAHEEALAIRRFTLGENHPDIAESLNDLGIAQSKLRDYASARKSHEEALTIRRKILPQDHPAIAQSLNNLGNTQAKLRDYASARKSLEETLAICRRILPKDHPDIAMSLNNLGSLQSDQRDYAAARKSHEEALAIRRKVLPKDHPDIAQSLYNLGIAQTHLRDYASAGKSC